MPHFACSWGGEDLELPNQLGKNGGATILLEALAERYPEKENADKIGEALQGVFGLSIDKNENTVAYTGRARTAFQRARKEGIDLPDVAKGFVTLRGQLEVQVFDH